MFLQHIGNCRSTCLLGDIGMVGTEIGEWGKMNGEKLKIKSRNFGITFPFSPLTFHH
jgi:hypothetical protein